MTFYNTQEPWNIQIDHHRTFTCEQYWLPRLLCYQSSHLYFLLAESISKFWYNHPCFHTQPQDCQVPWPFPFYRLSFRTASMIFHDIPMPFDNLTLNTD